MLFLEIAKSYATPLVISIVAPAVISYGLFVFFGEHFNPLKKAREVSVRRRIRKGRRIALAALLVGYTLVVAKQLAAG